MLFNYVPNGIIMKDWTPAADGKAFDLPRTLKPIEAFREELLVLTGLNHHNGQSLGDGAGDHARAGATWLTGVHPKKTQGADILSGVSVDQIAAKEIGKQTQFPSLELGLEDGRLVGGCDSGYSCAYSNTLCWSSPTTPVPNEINPRAVFERLFGGAGSVAERRARMATQRSILDSIAEDANDLQRTLCGRDRGRITDYLDNLREIERRIQRAESQRNVSETALEAPVGVPESFEEHVGLMFDLIAAAYQANVTRVFTFMLSRELSQRLLMMPADHLLKAPRLL